jgi:putative endonuclease
LWRQRLTAPIPIPAQPRRTIIGMTEKVSLATGRWSVYILRCGDGSLYTGIATDVLRRIREHENGVKGSRYLRGRGPLALVFQTELGDRSLASRAELRIKRLTKRAKEELITARRMTGLLGDLLAVDISANEDCGRSAGPIREK